MFFCLTSEKKENRYENHFIEGKNKKNSPEIEIISGEIIFISGEDFSESHTIFILSIQPDFNFKQIATLNSQLFEFIVLNFQLYLMTINKPI
jgi:hypothetical protein